MPDSVNIVCPHCGEEFPLTLDVSEGDAEFTIDCEVCCRPMKVAVRLDGEGGIESLDVTEE
ncbi:MAG: hypothetical protein JWQ83_626 [Lacunisphaera sp.]|nr:hypothetical protein [Lacunisphaera sp.]MDB6165486.1 hypothetical protein [Lacunisphaera sp.]